LAAQAGIHPSTVANLETGANAGPKAMRKLAEVLGVKPAALIGKQP
jgi:transcriptional regulator with XRE-family HTH domain